ncbi:D-alanyl-D-alanine carboxypeptidase family protein [Streptomyces sp. NPDC050504]|uniref:D-alanyl-D-alanine carboxypeptidase family protein n=1 Tax=Streptomyces sp. NPDC050504 TaxID=3365618 RepID=UPI0037A954FA
MISSFKSVRRAATVAVAGGLLLTASPLAAPTASAAPAIPSITAKGGYLLDQASAKPIYGKSNGVRRQMASTTKVTTAITVLTTPGVDLNRVITIKQEYRDYVVRNGASTADLKTGDKLTVRQLLSALMLPSGCDAAYALADTFGKGSTTAARTNNFIAQMNAKAKKLGLTNTKYDSFDGISRAGNNYTTPPELAKMARHAFSSAVLQSVVKDKTFVTKAKTSSGGIRTYTWKNTNLLLGSYPGAVGIKTGTGTSAGPCLVFAATKNGKTLTGVLMNSTSRWTDAAKVLDFGFGSSAARTMSIRPLPADAQRD